MKKGEIITLYYFSEKEELLYADVEFVRKKRNGMFEFKSTVYGNRFCVSADRSTVITEKNKSYKADISKAWYVCL